MSCFSLELSLGLDLIIIRNDRKLCILHVTLIWVKLFSFLPQFLASSGGQCVWWEWWRRRFRCLGSAVWWRSLGAGWGGAFQTRWNWRLSECDRGTVRPSNPWSAGGARHELTWPTQLVACHGGCLHTAQPGAATTRRALIIPSLQEEHRLCVCVYVRVGLRVFTPVHLCCFFSVFFMFGCIKFVSK